MQLLQITVMTNKTEPSWASPRLVESTSECKFYHAFEYPDGTSVEGDWDLRQAFGDYSGNVDVSGKRVLDMGTASGFMSFAFEQHGATVVSADVESTVQYTKVPYYDDISQTDRALYLKRSGIALERMKNSYWYSWHKFESKAQVYYGDLINLPSWIGMFDIGFIGQIMVHNRDPLGLLQAVAERTTDTLIISEGMEPRDENLIRFIPNNESERRPHGWFRFTTGTLCSFLKLMGFEIVSQKTVEYRNVVMNRQTPITTIVAKRLPNTLPTHIN